MTVSFCSPFFWDSKVMDTVVASDMDGSEWRSRRPRFRNTMFRRHSNLVRFISDLGVSEYSHERMAKKKAPMASW